MEKYGFSYEIKSDHNEKLVRIFYEECRASGIVCNVDTIFNICTYEQKA